VGYILNDSYRPTAATERIATDRIVAKQSTIPWLRIGAESVAIVVSILLAFALDAWYGGIIDQRLAADFQQRLVEELTTIRNELVTEIDRANRSIEAARYASDFFDGRGDELDKDRLVTELYFVGLDSLRVFGTDTYDDMTSLGRSGSIPGTDRRAAIHRAYRMLGRLQNAMTPYRDEYLEGVRAWIPQSVISQIRNSCQGPGLSDCQEIDLDQETVMAIVEHLSTERATLAFRMREQGLAAVANILDQAKDAVDFALESLR